MNSIRSFGGTPASPRMVSAVIYQPLDHARFAAFKKGVTKLIEQCKQADVKEVYLLTPPRQCEHSIGRSITQIQPACLIHTATGGRGSRRYNASVL